MHKKILNSLFVLLLSGLACRPVIAIGWEEFLFLFIVFGLLLGPPVYRFMRKVATFRGNKKKDQ